MLGSAASGFWAGRWALHGTCRTEVVVVLSSPIRDITLIASRKQIFGLVVEARQVEGRVDPLHRPRSPQSGHGSPWSAPWCRRPGPLRRQVPVGVEVSARVVSRRDDPRGKSRDDSWLRDTSRRPRDLLGGNSSGYRPKTCCWSGRVHRLETLAAPARSVPEAFFSTG